MPWFAANQNNLASEPSWSPCTAPATTHGHLICMIANFLLFLSSHLWSPTGIARPSIHNGWAYHGGVNVPFSRQRCSPYRSYTYCQRTRLCDHFNQSLLDMWSPSQFSLDLNTEYSNVCLGCFVSPAGVIVTTMLNPWDFWPNELTCIYLEQR